MQLYVSHEHPRQVEALLQDIDLHPAVVEPEDLGIAVNKAGQSYNMLAQQADDDRVFLYGVLTPHSIQPQEKNLSSDEDLPLILHNPTELHHLAPGLRGLDRTGKGIGARLYNHLGALAGWHDYGQPAALYRARIRPEFVWDKRDQDHTVREQGRLIAEHLLKQVLTLAIGEAKGVDMVHKSRPGAETLIWNQPPRAILRQRKNRGHGMPGIPATFALLRHEGFLQRASEGISYPLHR